MEGSNKEDTSDGDEPEIWIPAEGSNTAITGMTDPEIVVDATTSPGKTPSGRFQEKEHKRAQKFASATQSASSKYAAKAAKRNCDRKRRLSTDYVARSSSSTATDSPSKYAAKAAKRCSDRKRRLGHERAQSSLLNRSQGRFAAKAMKRAICRDQRMANARQVEVCEGREASARPRGGQVGNLHQDSRSVQPGMTLQSSNFVTEQGGNLAHTNAFTIATVHLDLAVAHQVPEEVSEFELPIAKYHNKEEAHLKKQHHKKKLCSDIWMFACVGTAALLLVVLTLVFGLRQEDKVIFETPSPSLAPTVLSRELAIRKQLETIMDKEVLPDTPHRKALNWILFEDPLQLEGSNDHLIQRFILALFYFQTSQTNEWVSCNPPSKTADDFSCPYMDFTTLPDNSVGYAPRRWPEIRWLSGTHECTWANIECDMEKHVTEINIVGQNLTGILPEEIQYMDKLSQLNLGFNHLTGSIPEAYGEMKSLIAFDCSLNQITGPLPNGFFQQPNLLQLTIQYNMITGVIPKGIGKATTLRSLHLSMAVLSGSLPTEMGLLTNLRHLHLSDNQLTGPLPSEMGQLTELRELKLSNNALSGPLPSELGLLPNLEEFLFASNNMGGSQMPEEFWNISSLVFIDFNGAGFGGTLSTNIGRLTNLQGFKASGNSFEGTIPSQIGLLDNLVLFWIHANKNLGGEMAIEICQLHTNHSLQFLNADCAGSMGETPRVACNCCTGCCNQFEECEVV